MIAAAFGHSRIVRILLDKGANPSVANDGGFTALHLSVLRGHLAVTKLLLEAGADLEAKSSERGSTPLHVAAEEGYSRVAKVLIEAGARPNSRTLDGSTPLRVASQEGHLAVTKLLVEAGSNLEAKVSETGSTPLYIAAQDGHSELVRVLIEAGANPTAVVWTVRHRCSWRPRKDTWMRSRCCLVRERTSC